MEQAIDYLPGKVRQAMGKVGQVQDMSSAQEQLGKEPIFCMETAIRLYYWSRLVRREGHKGMWLQWLSTALVRRAADGCEPSVLPRCGNTAAGTLRLSALARQMVEPQ